MRGGRQPWLAIAARTSAEPSYRFPLVPRSAPANTPTSPLGDLLCSEPFFELGCPPEDQ